MQTYADAYDKLQAVITHRRGSPEGDRWPDYASACREWFAKLSDAEKVLTNAAMIIYANGDKHGAAQMVFHLPRAPKRPGPDIPA